MKSEYTMISENMRSLVDLPDIGTMSQATNQTNAARRRALVIKNKKKVAELERVLAMLQEKLAEAIAAKKGTD